MSTLTSDTNQTTLASYKEQAFLHRAHDTANYVGDIDMEGIQRSYEDAFEQLAHEQGASVDFEEYIARAEDLMTEIVTAHPTFFKSREESGHLAKLFTAYAMHDTENARMLEQGVRKIQADHPYHDPTTDEEGEQLYDALKNTINPGIMIQRAMIKVAKEHYPDQWKKGRYSPVNRAIWQKFDRDGRKIPPNVQLGEALRQRRMGLELIYLPQLEALQEKYNLNGEISPLIERIRTTIDIYTEKEGQLAALDSDRFDMNDLQNILDDLQSSKDKRITHPNELAELLDPILQDGNTADELFEDVKIIVDSLRDNGLCFATPTHRVNAKDVHGYLNAERSNRGMSPLRSAGQIDADRMHFHETEEMIAQAADQVSGNFNATLGKTPADGRAIHEMMMIRRFVYDAIDSHTIEKIDIAEAHNAMTQRGLRLAAKQYGVSKCTDIGLLHEDGEGIDNARSIYTKLLGSKSYMKEISHTIPGTTKKRPRLVMKIGFSDFAKQNGSPGTKPYNEKCVLQTMRAIEDAGQAGEIDLDIEFAGGEGAGRRVNPKGYKWTLKETVTPAILTYAKKLGIRFKYRETIQGGDGSILLGTEESAAKVMATQLTHLSTHLTMDPSKIWDQDYYTDLREKISEHHDAARAAYHALYSDPDFALLIKLYKQLCLKGGSRKLDRGELKNPFDSDDSHKEPLADFRAIGFNAASIETGVHVPPIFGQGTAFYQNMERTKALTGSELFRERLMTAFMVRDLHMVGALKSFVSLYDPDYWRQFDAFDDKGAETVESRIAARLDSLVYPDDSDVPVHSRLQRAVGLLEDDLSKFDQIRRKFGFTDVEATIADGDYKDRVAQKRTLLSNLHESRLDIIRQLFIDLESTLAYSPDYTHAAREGAIKAGLCLDFGIAEGVFGDELSGRSSDLKGHAVAILDLSYNA